MYTADKHSTRAASHARSWPTFAAMLALLLSVYAFWLLTFWPGVLGHDSFAILRQIEQPDTYTSGKPAFWYYFVAAFYRPTLLVEVPIGAQMVFAAVVFARILAWQWCKRMRAVFFASLLLVCLAPHVVFHLSLLYPDGIFSVAASGLLFEIWLTARRRQLSGASLAMIALTLPVAVFARSNGLVLLVPVAGVLLLLVKADRYRLGAVALAWCALVAVGGRAHNDVGQGAMFPLAVFETVNFLQARAPDDESTTPKLSPPTIEVLARHRPLDNYLAYFDPYYWDPLVHDPQGPQVGHLSAADQQTIVQEFLRYNVWHNVPAFARSRINVFVAAVTARSGIAEFWWAKPVLENLQTRSEFRRFHFTEAEAWLTAVHDFGLQYRQWLWSPLPGVALLLWLLVLGLRSRSAADLLVTVPMVLQLGAIIVFSTAGEYRYLLPFTILPVLLLPMLVCRPARAGGAGRTLNPARMR